VQRRRSSSRWIGSHRRFSRQLQPPLKIGPIWRPETQQLWHWACHDNVQRDPSRKTLTAGDRPLVLWRTGSLSGSGYHVPGRYDEAVRMAEMPTESDGHHVNVRCWLHDAPSVQADVSGPFLSKAQPITTFLSPRVQRSRLVASHLCT